MMAEDRLVSRKDLEVKIRSLQGNGKVVGFTSGVFDLLHAGHVAYLEHAKSLCDVLVVAVNDDMSVQRNKGDKRPIVPASERALIVAGLGCVDFVFLFSDANNNRNVELLKPDIYIKAGDYQPEELTSKPLVEEYGGRVELVPETSGLSTSGLIDRIVERYGIPVGISEPEAELEPRPAVFLDRDGTLIEHVEYLHDPEKVKLIPGAIEGLKRLQEAGFRLIIVTNQPGIGMGYFAKEDLFRVNRAMLKQFFAGGVTFDRIYYSPHTAVEESLTRKPATGLVDRAVSELGVVIQQSYVVGDTTIDLQLARNAGCKAVLVKTGQGGSDRSFDVQPDIVGSNLNEAATEILKEHSLNR